MSTPALLPAAAPGADATTPPRRLRIAFVVHDYHRHGGHSRYVAELASRFKGEHEVHVFANTFEEPDPHGITFHRVPAWRANVATTVLSFLVPATLMTRGRFDVIHAQGVCGLRQNVVTAHICQGAWCEAMTRHTGRPRWRKRVFEALAYRLERYTFRRGGARRVIAVSRRTQDDLAAHYRRTEGVRVVHHGVDTELFHPRNRERWRAEVRRQAGVPADATVALYVGDAQKALPAAIRGVALVPGLHLLSVSRSPAEPYRSLVESTGAGGRVHLLPPTPHVERFYAAADLFVFPTVYDSFGLVATEAMAAGLPVVCSTAAGAAELIDDGSDGLVVDNAWDPATLAAALARLASDPDLRHRLGAAARRKAEAHTWDETARQTLAVYHEVAAP
jgi:UDP-glucose:(heptosyl)LPS alpha-1,3-glucosyltransferase